MPPEVIGKRRGSLTADGGATADTESTSSKNLPDGKDFHFFLSHKKQHSTYGGVPAEIARNLHDSLELLDYTGWLDVDRLAKITQEVRFSPESFFSESANARAAPLRSRSDQQHARPCGAAAPLLQSAARP